MADTIAGIVRKPDYAQPLGQLSSLSPFLRKRESLYRCDSEFRRVFLRYSTSGRNGCATGGFHADAWVMLPARRTHMPSRHARLHDPVAPLTEARL